MMSSPPLPTPPFLAVEGLANFRDAGGLPIEGLPGKSVRRHVLYRASEPSRLTDAGVATLQRLGITHTYDLRSQLEIDRSIRDEGGGVREWDGSRRVSVPIFLDEDYSPAAIALRFHDLGSGGAEGFVRVYGRILLRGAQPDHPFTPFPTILRHFAADAPGPLLVHCTAGKDRTGLICALILSLCGVSDQAVAYEYSLTDIGLGSRREEFVGHLLKNEAFKGKPEAAARMISSRRENMLATLAYICQTYGSVEQYVTDNCGLSAEEVARIRHNLIVHVEPLDWESHAEALGMTS